MSGQPPPFQPYGPSGPSSFPTTPLNAPSGPSGAVTGGNNAADPSVLELLGTYPFVQYTPSSRVARHLQSLNLTHSSASIQPISHTYPSHASSFARLDNPQSESDRQYWELNHQAALRTMDRFASTEGAGGWMGSPITHPPGGGIGGMNGVQQNGGMQGYMNGSMEYTAQPQTLPNPYSQPSPANGYHTSQTYQTQPRPQPHPSGPLAHPKPQSFATSFQGYINPPSSLAQYHSGSQSNSTQSGFDSQQPNPFLTPYDQPQSASFPSYPQQQAQPHSRTPQQEGTHGNPYSAPPPPPRPEESQAYLARYLAQIEAQRIVQEEEVKRIEEIEKERERGIANREKQRGIGSNDGPKKRVEVDGRERVGTKMELVEKPRAVVPAVPPVQRSSGQNSPQTQRTSSQSSSQSQRLVPVVEILVKTRPNESELSKKKYQPSGYRSPDDFDDDDDEEEEDDDHYDNDYSEFVPGEEPFPRKHHRGRRLSDSGIGMITPQRGTGYGTPNAARSGYMSISKSIKKDPYKILSDLLEDVFEAEDALPANLTKTDLYENRYFDRLSVRSRADDKVLLCRNVVVKLSQTLKMCRTTRKPTDGLIRGRELAGPSLEDWNVEELIRILKLLGRVTQEIDGLVVFNDDGFATRNATASTEALEDKGKPVKKKRKATKVTEGEAEGPLQEEVVQTVLEKLGRVIDAVLAGECIVTLLTAGDLPKPLYSEDMIAQTIESVALAVTDVVIPVLQALAGDSGIVSSVLASATSQLDPGAKRVRDAIYTVASSAVRFLHRLPRLINHPSLKLQEALVYKITQMVVQLVFMADPVIETKGGNSTRTSLTWKESLGGPSGTRLVKMEAIEVLKTLFSNQRAAEREEILTEILNGTAKVADLKKSQNGHRTRKGKTIHFVSALLLELMQTCSSGIHELLTEADVSDATTGEGGLATETNANSMIIQNTRILAQIMEDIDRSATHILKFLVNKISGANVGKQKSSFEANYRAIFEAYLEDQLEVLYTPEFPAAALSLGITARTFIPLLDDTKPSADNAAIRGIAIDHLGALVSTLRQFEITYNASIAPPSLRTIVAQNDLQAWSQLRQSNEMLLNTLRKNASQNGLYNSAADVMTAQWMLELYRVAKRDGSPEPSTETARSVTSISQAVDVEIKRAARKVGDDGVFGQAKDDLLAQADHPCITVEMTRPLQSALGPAFKSILTAMSAPIVAQRTKAIRALGMAAAIDPAYLIKSEIRNSLQDRISDSSPAVRDAAIDLIGKYIPEKPDVAFQYYASISDRIADTGLAVRKRVIKLFKIIHGLVNKSMIQVDICCKLVLMVDDEEDTVKELALATLTDLWFPLASAQTRRAGSTPVGDSDDKQAPEDIMQVVVNVVARYANDMNQIEQVISEIAKSTSRDMTREYSQLVGAMLDQLISDSDKTIGETLPLVRAIQLFSNSKPESMDLRRATSLLPYLKQATSPDEIALSEILMRIFRLCIPFLPKTATTFGVDLSKILLPMIAKPSGKLHTLEEAVICYCTVVICLTKEYPRLLTILKSCVRKIQMETDKAVKTNTMQFFDHKTLPFITTIGTLIVAKGNIDNIREERDDMNKLVITIAQETRLSEFMLQLLLDLWKLELDQTMKHAVVQCFGHMYQAFPTLMIQDASIAVMDSVLQGNDANQHLTLKMLALVHDVLQSQVDSAQAALVDSNKNDAKGPVDMEKLIGSTSGFAESGVGSAIIQRYLGQVLNAALSPYDEIQTVAVGILTLTITQGLAHPLQSFPVIVTLEASDSSHVSEKAFGLLNHLQSKHASIINTRYLETAKVVFEHRKSIDERVCGYHSPESPVALFDRWYTLIREKRQVRQLFLQHMCKAFSFESSPPEVTWDDVLLSRFMGENLSLLDYKVQEEVYQVVGTMTTLLANAGMHVVEMMNTYKVLPSIGEGGERLENARVVHEDDDEEMGEDQKNKVDFKLPGLINASAMVGIALILKNRLKKTYGLTEEKIIKFQPGRKTVLSDKAVVKKHDPMGYLPDWTGLSGVMREVKTVDEYKGMSDAVLRMIDEDGTMHVDFDTHDKGYEED